MPYTELRETPPDPPKMPVKVAAISNRDRSSIGRHSVLAWRAASSVGFAFPSGDINAEDWPREDFKGLNGNVIGVDPDDVRRFAHALLEMADQLQGQI